MRYALLILACPIIVLIACNPTPDFGGNGGSTSASGTGGTGGEAGGGATGGGGNAGTGGACSGGAIPTTLAAKQGIPVGITVDASNVYWVTQSGKGALWKVPKSGGQAMALLDGNIAPGLENYAPTWQPVSLFADGSSLYWTTVALGTGGLWKMPSAGGMPAKLADTGINATDWPEGLFVRSGIAYWSGYQAQNVYDARVFSIAPGAMLAQHDVSALGSYAQSVAADADHVYFTTNQAGSPGGAVARIPLAGGGPEKLADATYRPFGLAIDDTHLYFADVDYTSSPSGSIRRVPKSGGAVETLVTGAFGGYALAVDDTNVYFTDYEPSCGAVRSVPKGGGNAMVLASSQDMPLGIAVDDAFVYWTNRSFNDGGSVMKIAK